jgi:hypothetical protein
MVGIAIVFFLNSTDIFGEEFAAIYLILSVVNILSIKK